MKPLAALARSEEGARIGAALRSRRHAPLARRAHARRVRRALGSARRGADARRRDRAARAGASSSRGSGPSTRRDRERRGRRGARGPRHRAPRRVRARERGAARAPRRARRRVREACRTRSSPTTRAGASATSRGTSARRARAGRADRDRAAIIAAQARAPRARACICTRRSTSTTRRPARSASWRAIRGGSGRAVSRYAFVGDSGNDRRASRPSAPRSGSPMSARHVARLSAAAALRRRRRWATGFARDRSTRAASDVNCGTETPGTMAKSDRAPRPRPEAPLRQLQARAVRPRARARVRALRRRRTSATSTSRGRRGVLRRPRAPGAHARRSPSRPARCMHVSNYFYNEPNILLADELCRRTGFDRAFFCNSGAEANEALLKLARHHFFGQRARRSATRIIAFHNAFHGRTMGALSMTGTPKYREGFGELGPRHARRVRRSRRGEGRDGPRRRGDHRRAGAGRRRRVPRAAGLPRGAPRARDEHGALLLVDEVQTGIGRLGRFLGIDDDGRARRRDLAREGPRRRRSRSARCSRPKRSPARSRRARTARRSAATRSRARRRSPCSQILDDEKLVAGRARQGRGARPRCSKSSSRELPAGVRAARGEGLLARARPEAGFVARDILAEDPPEAGVLLTAAGERVLRFSPPLVVTTRELEEGVAVVRKVLAQMDAKKRRARPPRRS